MFEFVELNQLKLRWLGSKSVVKYPRCSIRRQSTYSDAEVINFNSLFCFLEICFCHIEKQILQTMFT